MPEIPDFQAIFDANPEHTKLLNSFERRVTCEYLWSENWNRFYLVVQIGDETRKEHLVKSWDYIKALREMLHNYQGPWDHSGPDMWKSMAHHFQKTGWTPKQIAVQLNKAVDQQAKITKAHGMEYQYPKGYPFINTYVTDMIKNWKKRLDVYREKDG